MQEENRQGIIPKRDISSKRVLGNPILYAQFLRNNLDIPFLKNIQPEDIEDVSERYIPYLGTEFGSDTVKRIRLHIPEKTGGTGGKKTETGGQEPLFLISLTEHKSRVDYNVSMQLLKYMLCIWLDYEKEMEQKKEGASDRKGFRYPLIIPIVYYEGKAPWTADRCFQARIACGNMLFHDWVPDFTYEVVRLHDYSNEELLERGDEMSLIMLFNKIQDHVDLSEFLKLPGERLDDMVRDTPEAILNIIVSVMESLCVKIGTTEEEMQECVARVRERRMGYLFENIEKMDIQAERRNTAEARMEAKRAQEEAKVAQEEAKAAQEEAKAAQEEAKAAREEIKEAQEALKKAHEKAEAEALNIQEEKYKSLVAVCKELGATREMTVEKVSKNCSIDKEEAEKKVDIYWEM